MEHLKPALHKYPEALINATDSFTERLQLGQSPEAFIIKCSMLNETPEPLQKFCQSGEILSFQTVAHLVPSYSEEGGLAEKASLEHAVVLCGVKNIIVCGHFPSRALKELVDQSLVEQDRLSLVPPSWQAFSTPTIELMRTYYNGLPKESLVNIIVQEHVLIQIDQLLNYPYLKERVLSGELKIHGWLYDTESKELYCYDFDEQQFKLFPVVEPNKTNKIKYIPRCYII